MIEGRQRFRLEWPDGPAGVRVAQPSDWATVPVDTVIELDVDGFGDIDVNFIAPDSAFATMSVAVDEASGHCTVVPPRPLAVGPVYVQVVRRHDAAVLAVVGVVVCLSETQAAEALGIVGAEREPLHAPPPPRIEGRPLFSVTTTVWNTPIAFLAELADNIRNQSWPDFEWLVLDNGSTDAQVVRALRALAQGDARIRYLRVEQNIHIVPGNRYLLEHAAGDFIVPVDSDDLVAFDALERLAAHLGSGQRPVLLYSDELKISEAGRPLELLWRTIEDPLGALSTCPASHLMAFSRVAALEANVYSDAYAQGSHDWDTYLRLTDQGGRAKHVPEVLYGWRVHSTSAAGNEAAKDYLVASQTAVVKHSLLRRGLESLFDVRLASDKIRLGYFHAARRSVRLPRIDVDIVVRNDASEPQCANALEILGAEGVEQSRARIFIVGGGTDADLSRFDQNATVHCLPDDEALGQALARSAEGAAFRLVIDAALRPLHEDWLRDAVGTMELDDAVGIVGGCIADAQRNIVHIGFVAALDGFLATPHVGQALESATKHAAFCRRRVMAVHGGLMLLRTRMFDDIGMPTGVDSGDSFHGIEYCLRARRAGWHTGYCPTLLAERGGALAPPAAMSNDRKALLQARYGDLLARDPYYNPFLTTRSNSYGALVLPSQESALSGLAGSRGAST